MRDSGHYVDQTAYVNHPGIKLYEDAIEQVSRVVPLSPVPYLGFYSADSGFESPHQPGSRPVDPP